MTHKDIAMSPYQERSVAQLRRWVEGDARHNDVDDECCPDFSCCMPACYERDRGARVEELNRHLKRHAAPVKLDS